uniref:Uncharacterized protein n=1 Tax=Ananas comosus var. bracteatus TaxID=296719 RepID=A0A6V7P4Q7_ANACO|nr:unnamed protein product [Ananas comosus var. bracteatus]
MKSSLALPEADVFWREKKMSVIDGHTPTVVLWSFLKRAPSNMRQSLKYFAVSLMNVLPWSVKEHSPLSKTQPRNFIEQVDGDGVRGVDDRCGSASEHVSGRWNKLDGGTARPLSGPPRARPTLDGGAARRWRDSEQTREAELDDNEARPRSGPPQA